MKNLLSFATLAVAALLMQTTAKAQTNTSTSGSTSSSSSSSGSASGSRSTSTSGTSSNQQRTNQRVNSTTNIPITFNSADPAGANGANGANAVDPAGANGSNGSNTGPPGGQPYYGQSDITVRTTPTVYAPPVNGGNPCTIGVSGGLSVVGWGAALGGTWVDQDCADRQAIAMVHNAGYTAEAREMMCNNKSFYMAARSVGKPCVARPQFEGPGVPAPPPIVQQQPVPIAPPQQQVIVKDRSNLPRCSRTIIDNCWAG